MIKVVIFDFDGTLADTLATNLQIIKDLGLNRGQEISESLICEFKNTNIPDFLKKNGISRIRLYFSFKKIRKELEKRMDEVDVFPGMKEEIEKLRNKGFRLGVLSSNSKKNIELFIEKHEISDAFDFVFTEKNIFGKGSKLKFIFKLLRLKGEDVVYVGDESRDIEAARKARTKSIAVTWGYNSPSILKSVGSSAIANSPKEMLKIIKDLNN